jgi:hypothetical protein
MRIPSVLPHQRGFHGALEGAVVRRNVMKWWMWWRNMSLSLVRTYQMCLLAGSRETTAIHLLHEKRIWRCKIRSTSLALSLFPSLLCAFSVPTTCWSCYGGWRLACLRRRPYSLCMSPILNRPSCVISQRNFEFFSLHFLSSARNRPSVGQKINRATVPDFRYVAVCVAHKNSNLA